MRGWLRRRRERRAAYLEALAVINRPMRRYWRDGVEYVYPVDFNPPADRR